MGLFDKKYCDICGEKIGMLGNRKLDDGNCCKECASKLSPFFSERRHSSVEEIREQLEYRAMNQEAVANFNATRTFGTYTKLMLDENAGKLIVTSATNLAKANPDVIDYSQITGCRIDIDEDKDEIMCKDAEGKEISYNPPQYSYSYDFYVVLDVNSPYFNEIKFKLNNSDITIKPNIQVAPARQGGMAGQPGMGQNRPGMGQPGMQQNRPGMGQPGMQQRPGMAGQPANRPGMAGQPNRPGMAAQPNRPGMGQPGMAQGVRQGLQQNIQQAAAPVPQPMNQVVNSYMVDPMNDANYVRFWQMGEEIKAALLGVHAEVRAEEAAANEPVRTMICPWCGATTMSTPGGFCEYCGGSMS